MQPLATSLVGGILPFGAVLQSCSGEQNLMLCFCIAVHVASSGFSQVPNDFGLMKLMDSASQELDDAAASLVL